MDYLLDSMWPSAIWIIREKVVVREKFIHNIYHFLPISTHVLINHNFASEVVLELADVPSLVKVFIKVSENNYELRALLITIWIWLGEDLHHFAQFGHCVRYEVLCELLKKDEWVYASLYKLRMTLDKWVKFVVVWEKRSVNKVNFEAVHGLESWNSLYDRILKVIFLLLTLVFGLITFV